MLSAGAKELVELRYQELDTPVEAGYVMTSLTSHNMIYAQSHKET